MRSVPPTLGRYEIGRLLGAGASGEVYLASLHGAMGFQKRFALKVFDDDRPGADPRRLGQFVNEGMLGEHLQHPNIVSVVEFGEDEGQFFLVMEFIDGISLRGVFELCEGREVALPVDAVCELGVQVCAALQHAHAASGRDGEPLELVHRDLKPANLILDRTGTVRVLDFGVARVAANPYYTTALGEIRGTPAYMAPEQVRADVPPTAAVDTYALGLVLCEAATGQPVYLGQEIEPLLKRVLAADVEDALAVLEQRAPDLVPVLRRALTAAVEERYGSAAELGEALREVWVRHGGQPRLGMVAEATLGLRPDASGGPGTARSGGSTLAVPTVADGEADEAGPVTWERFTRAFVDQLGEASHDAHTPSTTAERPVRRVPGWWVGVAIVLVALLVPALGIPLHRACAPQPELAPPVVPVGGLASGADAADEPDESPATEPGTPAPAIVEDVDGDAAADPEPTPAAEPTTDDAPAEATPPPPPPPAVTGSGSFQVNSRPWSEVWLDGARIGTTGTPSFPVAAGRHVVVLVQPSSGAEKRYEVDVPADATVKLGCWDFRAGARCGE